MNKMQKWGIICAIILIALIIRPGWRDNDQENLEGTPVPFSISACQEDLNASFQWQILNDSLIFMQVSRLKCDSGSGSLDLRIVQEGTDLFLYEIYDNAQYSMCSCTLRINGTISGVDLEDKVLKVIYVTHEENTILFEVNLV
jgi:hypothetical protein